MIDIKKFIKFVKKGNLFTNSFFTIKTSKGYYGDDDTDNDPAAKWLAEQEQKKQEKSVDPSSPSSTSTLTAPSVITQDPQSSQSLQSPQSPEVESIMDTWIIENRSEMEAEGMNDIGSLMRKKDSSPDESYLAPDPSLYRALLNDPSLHQVLVDKISTQTRFSDKNIASLFVDTMMAKTKNIMDDIDAVNARENEAVQDTVVKDPLDKKSNDPYAVSMPLPDTQVGVKAYNKLISLSPESKDLMYDAIHMKYTDEMLAKAIESKLSPPEEGKRGKFIDQRMNFFLKNPNYLQPVMDPGFEEILRNELGKMWIPFEGDIYSSVGKAYNNRKAKRRVCNILNNEKGAELHEVLLDVIEAEDPVIVEWLKGGMLTDEKMTDVSYNQVGDDSNMEQNLPGKTSKDIGDLNVTKADEIEASGIISEIMTGYLKPMLENAEVVGHEVVSDMMTGSFEKYKNSKSKDDKVAALKTYSIAEQFSAFLAPLLDHLPSVLSQKGKASNFDADTMVYANPKGKLYVPHSILKDVYAPDIDPKTGLKSNAPDIDRADHEALVKRYLERIRTGDKEPFVPKWNDLVSYKYPAEAYKQMGEVKKTILNAYAISKDNYDNIYNSFRGENEKILQRFAGVIKSDLVVKGDDHEKISRKNAIIKEKTDRFIQMTINQGGDYADQLIGFSKEKGEEDARSGYHQLLEDVGRKYHNLLGYLANRKKKNPDNALYSSGPVGILISLLDHHSNVRNFLRSGRNINSIDNENRTNTEIYYDLKGVNPPAHIKELLKIYYEGISKSSRKIKGFGTLNTEWYGEFFKKFDKFDRLYREQEKKQNAVDELKSNIDSRYDKLNKNLNKIVSKMNQKNNLNGYIESKVPDELESRKLKSKLKRWMESGGITNLDAEDYQKLDVPLSGGLVDMKKELEGLFKGFVTSRGVKVEGLNNTNQEIKNLKDSLKQILVENGYSPQGISALRLASVAYRVMMLKLSSLERMKQTKMKFASVSYVDSEIAKIKTEFNRYLNSLFCRS